MATARRAVFIFPTDVFVFLAGFFFATPRLMSLLLLLGKHDSISRAEKSAAGTVVVALSGRGRESTERHKYARRRDTRLCARPDARKARYNIRIRL